MAVLVIVFLVSGHIVTDGCEKGSIVGFTSPLHGVTRMKAHHVARNGRTAWVEGARNDGLCFPFYFPKYLPPFASYCISLKVLLVQFTSGAECSVLTVGAMVPISRLEIPYNLFSCLAFCCCR